MEQSSKIHFATFFIDFAIFFSPDMFSGKYKLFGCCYFGNASNWFRLFFCIWPMQFHLNGCAEPILKWTALVKHAVTFHLWEMMFKTFAFHIKDMLMLNVCEIVSVNGADVLNNSSLWYENLKCRYAHCTCIRTQNPRLHALTQL